MIKVDYEYRKEEKKKNGKKNFDDFPFRGKIPIDIFGGLINKKRKGKFKH